MTDIDADCHLIVYQISKPKLTLNERDAYRSEVASREAYSPHTRSTSMQSKLTHYGRDESRSALCAAHATLLWRLEMIGKESRSQARLVYRESQLFSLEETNAKSNGNEKREIMDRSQESHAGS